MLKFFTNLFRRPKWQVRDNVLIAPLGGSYGYGTQIHLRGHK